MSPPLLSRQDAPLLLDLFVIAPQPVYARDAELVAGAQFLHQLPILRPFEVLAGLLIKKDIVFRYTSLRHGNELPIFVLISAGYADVSVNLFH